MWVTAPGPGSELANALLSKQHPGVSSLSSVPRDIYRPFTEATTHVGNALGCRWLPYTKDRWMHTFEGCEFPNGANLIQALWDNPITNSPLLKSSSCFVPHLPKTHTPACVGCSVSAPSGGGLAQPSQKREEQECNVWRVWKNSDPLACSVNLSKLTAPCGFFCSCCWFGFFFLPSGINFFLVPLFFCQKCHLPLPATARCSLLC